MLHTVKLNRNSDFKRLYRRGKSLTHPILVTYCIKNRLGINRMGVTVSRKVGKAVQRNRARRVITEAYRQLEPALGKGWDFVFVARTQTIYKKMDEVKNVMKRQLKASGILPGELP